ncbi:hypothetical protein BPAE_0090g00050 [Botrytis paeoniae]|uniref:Uncharacterized protein n=1 Tax=Botrytis paeoniae TaxID=278948 RepID=A0A4Z1FTI8_9HELO|nr:hypothetical protein BPAE_0090g00050 [Botrytis paeoniae]
MISRLIEYNSLYKFHRSRDPELSTRDAKLAGKVLKSRGTIEAPQCTLSFMKCFGISMIPCGLLARCNSGEIRTASSFFIDEPSNQSTLTVTMDEPAIDTSHALSVIEPFTRANSTTIDSDSDREPLEFANSISRKRKSVIKETPVGKKTERGDKLRRKRILARNEIEKGDVNENESGSESENGNESIIVVENKRVIKTKDGSGDEDENESVIKVENERVIKIEDDSERQKERAIKIEDDSEREKKIYNKIEEDCDDSESSVDEDLYKAQLEFLSQVSDELSLLNSKKRKKQKKEEDKDKSGSKRVKIE